MRWLFVLVMVTPFLAFGGGDAVLSRFEGAWRAAGDVRGCGP